MTDKGITDTFEFQSFRKLQRSLKKPVKKVKPIKYLNYRRKQASKKKKRYTLASAYKLLKKPNRSALVRQLDKMVSVCVKVKDGGKCFRCGLVKDNAGVSHYFGRKHLGTRWNLLNCDWACWGCHFYHLEHEKTEGSFYHNYMLKKLGRKGFNMLKIKAYATSNKFSTADIQLMIDNFGLLYEKPKVRDVK